MKKKLAFLVAITPNIAFAAGNIAIALNKYMHFEEYEVLVYYTDLSERDIDAFHKIRKCKIKQFRPRADLVDFLLQNLPNNCPYREKNKLMLLGHYEIFSLLDEYENVVWLDADILVQGSLSGLLDGLPFAITADTPWTVRDQFITRKVEVKKYQIDIPAVCTAVIAVNDSLPYKDVYNWLIEKTFTYAPIMKNIDQVTINLMLQEFGILPSIMPLDRYQCMPWKEDAFKAEIVHFGTADKVWKSENLCKKFAEWYRNHLIWLEIGGTDFRRDFRI